MDYIDVGYNYRMSSMTAALGLAQLKKIDQLIALRRKVAAVLDQKLSIIKQISLLKKNPNHFAVHQMYPILLQDEQMRNALQQHLASKGIMTKVYFNPAHLKTIYIREYGLKEGDLPETEKLSKRELCLPFYPNITQEDLDYLIASIESFFKMPR